MDVLTGFLETPPGYLLALGGLAVGVASFVKELLTIVKLARELRAQQPAQASASLIHIATLPEVEKYGQVSSWSSNLVAPYGLWVSLGCYSLILTWLFSPAVSASAIALLHLGLAVRWYGRVRVRWRHAWGLLLFTAFLCLVVLGVRAPAVYPALILVFVAKLVHLWVSSRALVLASRLAT